MIREPIRDTSDRPKTSKDSQHVNTEVWTGAPVVIGPPADEESEDFTEDVFEDALDKVSRPLRGRLAHAPYSSEDLIREKREEAELEDRPS